MKLRRNYGILILIFILTAASGFFIYGKPAPFLAKFLPWRLGLDIVGGTELTYEIDLSGVQSSEKKSLLSGLRDIMERRVNLFGVSEPQVVFSESQGKNYLIVDIAGIKNTAEAVEQIGRVAFLEFREVKEVEVDGQKEIQFTVTELNGRYLTSAQLDSTSVGQPQVALKFSSQGAKIFADLTKKNIGKPLTILIDNQLVSAPVVREEIVGGNAVITGLSRDEAISLVNLLNAGALPAPLNLVTQNTIGATLGSEFLKKAIMAGVIGALAVMIFISFYYRSLGVFASLALLIYIALALGVFKLFSVTMSLSGIAGFILSIGMAVDANILIFERTKEEIKKGLTRLSALEEGFRRAWPSIRDSNISTLITCVILYYSTTSFVRGFALTLLIGVLMSMFSAITVTRTMLRAFVK